MSHIDSYDVVVVGAGHAGCEAALAAARMGVRTLLVTMNLGTVAQMSCNPAIGGLAKGHLVREIDALGGEMGVVADLAGIQFRMLNRSKGPAVWSPRAQEDRQRYSLLMKQALERQQGLRLLQAEVVGVEVTGGAVRGVRLFPGERVATRSIVLAPGTFLNGLIHIGLSSFSAGRAGEFASSALSEQLRALGFRLGRMKTGTPPRVDGRTVDWASMTEQPGDPEPEPFSFRHDRIEVAQVPCFLTWTNERTHELLRGGLQHSPLYTGKIVGVGPRYCPSIETKIVRFSDKPRHQIFLEPEGKLTSEYYVNGFSTSLPEDVQCAALRTVPGLERVEVTRYGYAIEYDYVPATQLQPTLEAKLCRGLFLAGQINGTSGYEEAAAQGLVAGANAALFCRGEAPFIPTRAECYIGVLIDDLVTKGPEEPYRMFTSLAEHRLVLRQDNADLRLLQHSERLGMAPEEFCRGVRRKQQAIEQCLAFVSTTRPPLEEVNQVLERKGLAPVRAAVSLKELLRRPELAITDLAGLARHAMLERREDPFWRAVARQVEIEVKYEGFIVRQREQMERFQRLEAALLPPELDYGTMRGLSAEAREKLQQVRPRSLGQAARIPGVRQGDIAVLMVHLARHARTEGCST
ncbi:MAG: tRNA uridine-5-carboxymethylaminomethyl(34) synthesis enzyme MnmG [Candidatus Oleimicrobiaceae bacterium]